MCMSLNHCPRWADQYSYLDPLIHCWIDMLLHVQHQLAMCLPLWYIGGSVGSPGQRSSSLFASIALLTSTSTISNPSLALPGSLGHSMGTFSRCIMLACASSLTIAGLLVVLVVQGGGCCVMCWVCSCWPLFLPCHWSWSHTMHLVCLCWLWVNIAFIQVGLSVEWELCWSSYAWPA